MAELRLALLLLACCAFACARADVVVVDELHYRGPAGDSQDVPEYDLRQTTSIELDASRYTLFTADNYPAPNAVHVVLTPGERIYRASCSAIERGPS